MPRDAVTVARFPSRARELRRRQWIGPSFVALGLALLPWSFWLVRTLPSSHVSRHWDVAWGGFDLALAAALLSTALAAMRRSPWLQGSAVATGTLLLVDAWFDVLTAGPGSELAVAAAEAGLVEVPLAILSFWLARDTERFCRQVERCLELRRSLRRRRRLTQKGREVHGRVGRSSPSTSPLG